MVIIFVERDAAVGRTGPSGNPCMDLNRLGKRIRRQMVYVYNNPSIAAGSLEGTSYVGTRNRPNWFHFYF